MSDLASHTTSIEQPPHPLLGTTSAEEEAEALEVRRIISRVGRHLSRPPRIAIVGEFNTGKSTLTQALVGNTLLPQSIAANTRLPLLIHYAAKPALSIEFDDSRREVLSLSGIEHIGMSGVRMLCLGLPIERLKSFEVIDTPGLATGRDEIDELAIDACQRSNVAVWCTAAMQAWKRTELSVWESLPKRLKANSILAVTYKDALDSERDIARLRARLRQEAAQMFRNLVLVAATDAAASSGQPAPEADGSLWHSSGGAGLSAAINSAVSLVLAHRLTCAERLLSQLALAFEPEAEGDPAPATH